MYSKESINYLTVNFNYEYKTPNASIASGFMLSACDKQMSESNCSSETAYKLIGQTIIEAVEKQTASDKYSDMGIFIFDKAKIRASLNQLQIAVESVRTTKEDPNSSKKFCSATLKVTIPTSMLADADQGRELNDKTKISEAVRELNIDNSINVFTKKDFEYSVQPTDDGKELYVELESTIWISLLHDITWSALLKPKLEEQKAEKDRQITQEKENVAQLKQEAEVSKLEAERLSALQEKQEADRLKQDLLAKQASTQLNSTEPLSANVDQQPEGKQQTPDNSQIPQNIKNMLVGSLNGDEHMIMENKLLLESRKKPEKGDKKLARKFNEEALLLLRSQSFNQSVPILVKASELDPSDVEILNNLGFSLMKTRALDKALLVLINALTIKPDRASAWANLADVLALQGNIDLATAGYMNVYRFSGNREKTYKSLQNPQLHEDSPYVREAIANAAQKIIR